MLSYISILAVVIGVLNTYPIIISRDLVFASKETSLVNEANQISMSIGALESMTQDNVSNVMSMLDTGHLARITVINSDNDVLYQEISRDGVSGISYDTLIRDSLEGNDEFKSKFESGTFYSGASVPIYSGGRITGSVFIAENDSDEGAVVLGLRDDLRKISIAIAALTIIMCLVYSSSFTLRITKILNAIKNVREGEYTYRINTEGHDELAQLSDEFNSLTNRLQVNEETRRRFVADASHDLKTPLASIRLLSDSILQNANMDIDTVHEFVSDIRDESERLARTTGQLLDLTKLDNNIATVRTSVDCGEVAQKVVRMLTPIAEDRHITIEADADNECFVMASEDDLYQIISNLAENAIKYNHSGGFVRVLINKLEKQVAIKVSDNGIGIPEDDLPYIFDRFYRVDKSRNREAGGSGLGLSIVKSTAEKHGGEVKVEKNSYGGMDFIIIFPLYYSTIK